MDLVFETAADEHRTLVAQPQRPRIINAARVELDLKALGQFEFCGRQFVGRRWNRRRCDRGELGHALGHVLRTSLLPRRWRGWGGRLLCGRGPSSDTETDEGSRKQQASPGGRAWGHDIPP